MTLRNKDSGGTVAVWNKQIQLATPPNISDWNAIKEFSDGIVEVKDSLKLSSERYSVASNNLFSHFHALLIHKDSYDNDTEFAASWVASGRQFLGDVEIEKALMKSVNNIRSDPRIASSGVMLVDCIQNILFGFLFTDQSLYIVSGRHPIPPFHTFDSWKATAKYDEYIRMSCYGAWLENNTGMSWQEFYLLYKLNDLSVEYKSWLIMGSEPWFWDKWVFFSCESEAHLGMVEVYSREKISEEVSLAITVSVGGTVRWFVNESMVFQQIKAGTRLLSQYRVLDTGDSNLACSRLHLTPMIGTFSWMDAFLPRSSLTDHKDKCDANLVGSPLVKIIDHYVNPVPDKLGNCHKLCKDDFASDDYESQLVCQGAAITVLSYSFRNQEAGIPTVVSSTPVFCTGEGVKIDLRELVCARDYNPEAGCDAVTLVYDSDED